jgi:hypothetical protein
MRETELISDNFKSGRDMRREKFQTRDLGQLKITGQPSLFTYKKITPQSSLFTSQSSLFTQEENHVSRLTFHVFTYKRITSQSSLVMQFTPQSSRFSPITGAPILPSVRFRFFPGVRCVQSRHRPEVNPRDRPPFFSE